MKTPPSKRIDRKERDDIYFPPRKNMNIIKEWIGTDGHTYIKLESGEIGHLECEKCEVDKKK
jgi:hypothetical protein